MSSPDGHDAPRLLSKWWDNRTAVDENDFLTPDERLAITAPFGRQWPGLAPSLPARTDPDLLSDEFADKLVATPGTTRLGLVIAGRGADALTVAGWEGPLNYTGDTAEISAVLRGWEDRFGVRVVGVGFDTLFLSVAAPPSTRDEALLVAAEHFAFCPDNVWQSQAPSTLASYAETLIDSNAWEFWWD
ncbi:DUF4253 domain-containing protein [Actinokineospora sp. HUAS TT18]|uniref:DUF4253 domain-containing protein n=1 Tax=Actinokineospora sp. HUAS TT18 TaxID=3447451 RepID=UPI003F5215A0